MEAKETAEKLGKWLHSHYHTTEYPDWDTMFPLGRKMWTEDGENLQTFIEQELNYVQSVECQAKVNGMIKEIKKHKVKGGGMSGHFNKYCIVITDIDWEEIELKMAGSSTPQNGNPK